MGPVVYRAAPGVNRYYLPRMPELTLKAYEDESFFRVDRCTIERQYGSLMTAHICEQHNAEVWWDYGVPLTPHEQQSDWIAQEEKMDKLVVEFEGKKYEVAGYLGLRRGDVYLDGNGIARRYYHESESIGTYLKLRPIVVEHTIGGVVFEETGEVRKPCPGDWYIRAENSVVYTQHFLSGAFPIVRPVRMA